MSRLSPGTCLPGLKFVTISELLAFRHISNKSSVSAIHSIHLMEKNTGEYNGFMYIIIMDE